MMDWGASVGPQADGSIVAACILRRPQPPPFTPKDSFVKGAHTSQRTDFLLCATVLEMNGRPLAASEEDVTNAG